MTEGKSLAVPGDRTWNICMLAHVDHGKSALSDCLISANGIISSRMAGKVRYMDSRPDEQLRGITMKSSSIALGHRAADADPLSIVHLVDSPGHVDFTGEVQAALRVCDGAILVVDVVEGVCVQTVTVLRAALEHAVRPVLVLNKIDRLFSELNLTPMEAYRHIQMVIEQVNVIMGVREVEQIMEEADLRDTHDAAGAQSDWTLEDSAKRKRSESGYFSPELGNVAFASAVDGWAFRLSDFAKIFSKRFGISEKVLARTLWGDFYLQAKAKKIVRKNASEVSGKAEPMFSKIVMASIHSVYDGVLSSKNDPELALKKRAHICEKLGLELSNRDLKHRDAGVVLNVIMGSWLPAARCLLEMITEKLPSAAVAQASKERVRVLWPHLAFERRVAGSAEREEAYKAQRDALENCASKAAPVLAVVTKMIETSAGSSSMEISQPKPREEMLAAKNNAGPPDENEQKTKQEPTTDGAQMIAFARVLSGTVTVGQKLHVYSPKYKVSADGTFDESTVSEATVSSLHLLMGRSTDRLRAVSAGSIVGIGGVDEAVLKMATLSTQPPGMCLPAGLSLPGMQRDAVVRVAVEPHLPGQLPVLAAGLRKLNQSDPSVETMVTASGEYVIAASGELHLERCMKDLRENFARGIAIHVSKPIASFRETVVGGHSEYVEDGDGDDADGKEEEGSDSVSGPKKKDGVPSPAEDPENKSRESLFLHWDHLDFGRFVNISNSQFSFRVFAAPVPENLASALDAAGASVRAMSQDKDIDTSACISVHEEIEKAVRKDTTASASKKFSPDEFESFWMKKVLPHVWTCGPRRFGSNLLVGPYPSPILPEHMRMILLGTDGPPALEAEEIMARRMQGMESSIATGFQLGVQSGPLCEEPMHGVAFFIDKIVLSSYSAHEVPSSDLPPSMAGTRQNVSGLAIGSMKLATRNAFLQASPRLMEAVLRVDIAVTSDALGGTYTVIGKRRGRVIDETIRDGVNVFGIEAVIPVVESFGFADLVRKQTSGFAVPQMRFSHWETVDIDPFWEPRTEEELEELGVADATAENNNLARKLMNGARRRKGLRVEEKIVENAEKQRTLSRKK